MFILCFHCHWVNSVSKGIDSLTLTYVEQVLGKVSQLLKSEWESHLVDVESRHLESLYAAD